MSSEIVKTTLEEYLNFKNGKSSPNRDESFGTPVYGSNGLIGYSEESNAESNSLIIGRVGSYCGSVYHSNTECWITDNAIIATPKNKSESHFWYYLLLSSNLHNFRSGSGQPLLNQATLNSISVSIPRDSENRIEIGELLNTFDQKIHLNQQTNETLEAMAQAIFKSWFVDFDAVRAKIAAKKAGRDPEKAAMAAIAGVSLEMDWDEIEAALQQKLSRMKPDQATQLRHTASLFSGELVESELGEVPKGWGVKSFYDTIEIIGGGTPKTKIDEYWNGNILWYSVVDAPNVNDVFVIDTEKKITRAGLENSSAKLVDAGTTIISARGTVGKLALTPKPMTYNQSCYGLKSKNNYPFFNFYKTKQLVERLKRGSHGSVFDTITQKTFKTIDIVQPPENLEKRFDEAVEGLMNKIKKNSEENITLSQLRDTLLPKLISGEDGFKSVYNGVKC